MSNEELVAAIQAGAADRMVELWGGQMVGLCCWKAKGLCYLGFWPPRGITGRQRKPSVLIPASATEQIYRELPLRRLPAWLLTFGKRWVILSVVLPRHGRRCFPSLWG